MAPGTEPRAMAERRQPSGATSRSRAEAERIIDTAMELAGRKGWDRVSLLDIAHAAGVSLASLYAMFPGKQAILEAFSQHLDTAVLNEVQHEDAEETARDRLFDVLMLRFDHLQAHRQAIASILRTYQRDPLLALGGLRQLRHSMRRMLEAADLDSSGLRGELRLAGLSAIYTATLRTWLDDDSPDMAKTMADLDGYLRRIERPAAMLDQAPLVRRPDGSDTATADSA